MALYLRCTIVLTISQVELNLFTERHDTLSGAARRAEAEARAEKARADLTLTLTTLNPNHPTPDNVVLQAHIYFPFP